MDKMFQVAHWQFYSLNKLSSYISCLHNYPQLHTWKETASKHFRSYQRRNSRIIEHLAELKHWQVDHPYPSRQNKTHQGCNPVSLSIPNWQTSIATDGKCYHLLLLSPFWPNIQVIHLLPSKSDYEKIESWIIAATSISCSKYILSFWYQHTLAQISLSCSYRNRKRNCNLMFCWLTFFCRHL